MKMLVNFVKYSLSEYICWTVSESKFRLLLIKLMVVGRGPREVNLSTVSCLLPSADSNNY